jgi:hypothetical protein
MALFSGQQTREALIAAMRVDRFVETVIAFFESLGKK